MPDPRPTPMDEEPARRLAGADDRPAAASAEAADRLAEASAESDAWAALEARWGEAAAHRAYLARFPDLDGLGNAGRRYRAVLAARPGDAMALAMKAEIVRRATVVGLAMLPRAAPPAATGRWRRVSLVLLASWLGSSLAWILWKLVAG